MKITLGMVLTFIGGALVGYSAAPERFLLAMAGLMLVQISHMVD